MTRTWFISLGVAIITILAMSIGGVIGKSSVSAISKAFQPSEIEALKAGLERGVAVLQSELPKTVDERSTLVEASVVGTVARYLYEVHGDENNGRLERVLRKAVTARVCGSTDVSVSIAHGATYRFTYRSADKRTVADFSIDRNDCQMRRVEERKEVDWGLTDKQVGTIK